MRNLFTFLVLLLFVSSAQAEVLEGRLINLFTVSGESSLTVPDTSGSVFSYSFPTGEEGPYTLAVKTSSDGAIDYEIIMESGFSRPATEGTTDTSNYADDSTTPTINVVDSDLHIYSFTPPRAPYGRFKFTGQSGNHSSTAITTLKLFIPKKN